MSTNSGWVGIALFAVALGAGSEASAEVFVSDPLTAASFPGRGSKGGSFGTNGWTTTNAPTDGSQDAVWYEIADALPSGAVQFTVTGLSVGGTLTGTDHDIFCIYQAPDGQAEPIEYSPYFRNNDFKAFLRIFGTQEVDRPGAMKLEFAFCPRGAPWHHDYACPAECDKSGLAYAGGSPSDIGWDAATPYTMRVEWIPGSIKFFRNGAQMGEVSFTGVYAPKPLRVRIGSPRHDGIYPGLAFMPAGLVFRDLSIEGTPGEMTPVCGGSTVDGGSAGGTGTDAGSGPVEHAVLQDVTGASWEPGVFPNEADLNVEGAPDGQPAAVVYLKFPPAGGAVDKAVLRLHASADGSASGGSGIVCRVDDDGWQETTLTWANRPPPTTSCAGNPRTVDPDTEIEWDVSSLISGSGNVNLAIVSTDPDGAHFLSKEAGGASTGPRLLLSMSGSAGSAGAGGSSWGDAGSNGGSAGSSRGSTSGEESGCGCRTGSHSERSSVGLLAALLLAAACWRRAARRS